MVFDEISEFRKDLKGLLKKYRSLNEDLVIIKKVLTVDPDAAPPFSFKIDGLKTSSCIIKIKKIACKSLKTKGVNSGLRIIYAYYKDEKRIVFIELFHKNNKAIEDRSRILKYFK